MKIDIEAIFKHITQKHAKFIEDSTMSPAEFEALSILHIGSKCGGNCGFCEIDRSAAEKVIQDIDASNLLH